MLLYAKQIKCATSFPQRFKHSQKVFVIKIAFSLIRSREQAGMIGFCKRFCFTSILVLLQLNLFIVLLILKAKNAKHFLLPTSQM